MVKEKFLEIVKNSQLNDQDKKMWGKFIEVNNEEIIKSIY